jgi:hypothetical protein
MTRRALLALAALVVAACGKVGAPAPPESRLPTPVEDLEGFVRPGAIELTWTTPRRRVDGTPLRVLAHARVYRFETSGTAEPRAALLLGGRVNGYEEVARIDLRRPEAAAPGVVIEGPRVRFADVRDIAPGRRYTYVVLTQDADGRLSAPSARRTLAYVPAPAAPAGVEARAGEQRVDLRWQPPTRLLDGSPLTGELSYEVLRALGPDAAPTLVTPEPLRQTEFTDRGLENDRTYAYRVRAIRSERGTLVRGEPSERIAATPRDMTPPAPPRDLVAVPAGRDVRLAWTASPDPDVAAHIVYRAAEGAEFIRVGSVAMPATTFVDRAVPPGSYRYAVSAVDVGVQPNESARAPEAAVRLP